MRVLYVTQALDLDEPVLSTYHEWVAALAERVDHVEAICLKEGRHALPKNVRVHSLGKENGRHSKMQYALRFFKLSWKLRNEYDVVFVHMNQEYILIAGWLWKLLGKKVYLWRNHYAGSVLTDIAAAFCEKVFCTSTYSYTAKYAKTVLMPVGVDTGRFTSDGSEVRSPRSVLFMARMAPSKHPEVLLEALRVLMERSVEFTATFVGSPLPEHARYYESLIQKNEQYGLTSRVTFLPAVPNDQLLDLYRRHTLFVNCSRPGMLDKTQFEAASSGAQVVTASPEAAVRIPGSSYFDLHLPSSLPNVLEKALAKSTGPLDLEEESLRTLIGKIHTTLSNSPEKKKVLIAINCFNIGGAPTVALAHLRSLDRTKYEPWLMTLYASKPANLLDEARAAVGKDHVVEFSLKGRSPFDFGTLLSVYRFLRREHFDAVVTHLFLANLLIRPLAVLAGVRRIISFEHSRYEEKRTWQKICDRVLAQFTFRIVVATEVIASFTAKQERIAPERFFILPNPVAIPERDDAILAALRTDWELPEGTFIFLCIGRFSEEKGHRYLIEAARLLAGSDTGFQVRIIGHGSQEGALRSLVHEAGVASCVQIITDPVRAPHGYYLADAFVLPSLREGESIVAREAMCAGLPVVASDLPTLRPLLTGGAEFVPAADPEALASSMRLILRDQSKRELLAARNLAKASEFDTAQVMRTFESLLV